jgi:hypothetical protein
VGEIHPEIFFGVELPGSADQSLGRFGINAPVRHPLASASVERRTGSRQPMPWSFDG